MMNYIDLGQTTPAGEECAQLGSEGYMKNARIESKTYLEQLIRTFGEPPEGVTFKRISCSHELGIYLDLRLYYDDENQSHVMYIMQVEEGCEVWDVIAKERLEECNYQVNA